MASSALIGLTSGLAYVIWAVIKPRREPCGGDDFLYKTDRNEKMAKSAMIKIKLLSTADTGYFYVTKKNARTKTEKFVFKKYDPVVRKHVEFKETKIK